MKQVNNGQARAASVLLLVAAAAGCADDQPAATRTSPDEAKAPAFNVRGRSPRDVPEVRIDLPAKARAWDNNPTALANAISEGEGYAVVAFKEPGNPRALEMGRRGAVTAGTVTAGIQLLERHGAEILDLLDAIGGARVRISPQAAAEIAGHPLVDFVEPRQYGEVQAQTTPAGIKLVQASDFWTATGITGAGAKIEIVDTGWQPGHPDLPAIPAANCSGFFGGCDDSAGANWHGTHVMGVITARNNADGVVGAAPGIAAGDIYVYGACSSLTGSCPTDQVTAGINAGIWNVHLMNLSVVQPFDLAQSTAVGQAWNSGILLIAAAGNNLTNTLTYPANYANVIGVSGVKADKSFASTSACGNYSNQGSHVDLAAPFEANSTMGTNTYGVQCGTSMAAAHVTGVAALLKSQNPTWTNQQIASALFARAEDLGTVGRDNLYGHGLVRPVVPTTPTAVISGPNALSAAGTYSWNSNPAGGNGAYTYAWDYRVRGAATWTPVGTAKTYSRSVAACAPSFDLRVTVSSAGMSASDAHLVDVTTAPQAAISGTTAISTAGAYTWTASASCGSGAYTYSWEYRPTGGTWTQVGTASSYSRNVVAGDPHFELRVTVTSAGLAGSATHAVAVNLTQPVGGSITGPALMLGGRTGTWQSNPTGGNGTYTYQWQYRASTATTWTNVGTAISYSRFVSNLTYTFYLRVIVTSGGLSYTTPEHRVNVSYYSTPTCLDSSTPTTTSPTMATSLPPACPLEPVTLQ